ncbi:MAG TPA: phenylalanine--tRNA ligase subunit beta [Candidatus Dormibacteraeota bacterium]
MKMSLRWLRDYAPLDAPVDYLVETLVETGTEVGAVEDVAAGVVVARVSALEPLPGSTHGLRLATIDIGAAQPRALADLGIDARTLQLVTGAPNVAVGDLVAYAPPGTRPPGMDEPVGVRTFRSYRSPGVLLSAAELSVGDDASGLLILSRGQPGEPLRDVLDLDVVIDVEVTTNRPDCLCHVGIARELAAGLGERLAEPDTTTPDKVLSAASSEGRASVSIEDPEGCPRFTAAVIEGIAVGPSPQWLQARLRAVGLRPINNVVDVTNYVAHELGQPLHAFDLDRFAAVSGERRADVRVRRARGGERVVALDGVERVLERADMVVCAGDTPVSIAGVIGGLDTAVNEETRTVLLEAASWDGVRIRATSRRLGVRTDASTLFEKGLSDTLPPLALGRAATLIAEAASGHVLRGVLDEWPRPLPRPQQIEVSAQWLSAVLGTPVDASDAATVLARLGFAVEQDGAVLRVVPPHFRRDVTLPVDVVEEVGRMIGYGRVPSTLPGRRAASVGMVPPVPVEDLVREVCLGAGFDEAITFSFVAAAQPGTLPGLGGARKPIGLRNPLTDEWRVLRTSQLPGLSAALALNLSRGVGGVRLFELGRVFWEGERTQPPAGATPDGQDRALPPLPLEPLLLTLVSHSPGEDAGDAATRLRELQSVLARVVYDLTGTALATTPAAVAGMRGGRAGDLLVGATPAGLAGELAPGPLATYGIRGRVVVAELRLDSIVPEPPRRLRFRSPPRFPAVTQDLAVIVAAQHPAGVAIDVIRRAGGSLLESVELYDEYRGERVTPGYKGWTFELSFRAPDRTLTSGEAQRVQELITTALRRELGAQPRR